MLRLPPQSSRLLFLSSLILLLAPTRSLSLVAAEPPSEVNVPGDWKSGIPEGSSVYFAWFKLPKTWDERRVDLFLEAADDSREIFINGKAAVNLGAPPPNFVSGLGSSGRYEIKPELLRFGEWNLIEIRIYRMRGARGNFNMAAPALFNETQGIHLAGTWGKLKQLELTQLEKAASIGERFRFEKIEPSADILPRLQKLEGELGPFSPADSLKHLKTFDGLEVDLVLAEPDVAQPLSMKWDSRGRLWVSEYLQYPNPAGLKAVSRDEFLRTVYDKVPLPPPHGAVGIDRISIHEDTDGDGKLDRHTAFLNNLNLSTSFEFGKDGVYVLNPPYLLFYPDRNHDDVPDSDPEVLLEGFGLEDSHSIANSLRWGPDGWLYGAQGSTVTGQVRRYGSDDPPVHSMGQLIWRYHPVSKKYEIYAEGGGNTFGVEFDAAGRIYSGHNGGDTRGFHYVQGGYSQKGFSKHGALSNPYSFGYFSWMKHPSVPRFTHTFVIEEGGVFPEPFANRLYGVEPLQGRVVMTDFVADGSTFQTKDVGHALVSEDTWFRPIDIKSGPDGLLYVADMYEQRIDHGSHYQGRVDNKSGRIYRIRPKNVDPKTQVSLPGKSPSEWIAALRSPNKWTRQTALHEVMRSGTEEMIEELEANIASGENKYPVDSLWALFAVGGLSNNNADRFLKHANPQVRLWTIRLLVDSNQLTPDLASLVAKVVENESSVYVRSQVASSARRVSGPIAFQLIASLIKHDEDSSDPHVPLLIWWAIESKAKEPNEIISFYKNPQTWDSQLFRNHLAGRGVRRFAAIGTRESLLHVAELLRTAPDGDAAQKMLAGFDEALQGRILKDAPVELIQELAKYRRDSIEIKLLLRDPTALPEAHRLVSSPETNVSERKRLLEILGALKDPSSLSVLLELTSSKLSNDLYLSLLSALQSFSDESVAMKLLEQIPNLDAEQKQATVGLLVSRSSWTLQLIESMKTGTIKSDEVPVSDVRRMLYHREQSINEYVAKTWPSVSIQPEGLDPNALSKLETLLTGSSGNPYNGRDLYNQSCSKCHRLFATGGDIGPDLTSFQRTDVTRILTNILAPSLEVREGFETVIIETTDGLTVSGFVVAQDEQTITIRQADGQSTVIEKESISDQQPSKTSLMPTGLLDKLSEQQIRDLFAYLRSTQPLP